MITAEKGDLASASVMPKTGRRLEFIGEVGCERMEQGRLPHLETNRDPRVTGGVWEPAHSVS